jgi:mRNA interferase MazF
LEEAYREANREADTAPWDAVTFELLIDPKESGLPKPSKVQAQQIRTIAKKRITGAHLGRLTLETLKRVQGAIRLHLALA